MPERLYMSVSNIACEPRTNWSTSVPYLWIIITMYTGINKKSTACGDAVDFI